MGYKLGCVEQAVTTGNLSQYMGTVYDDASL